MRNIKVPVPSLAEQKKFVAKIEALEKQIAEAQALIDGAAARKQAILGEVAARRAAADLVEPDLRGECVRD